MSERDAREWRAIKSDPVRYAAYLERKRNERAARKGYEAERKQKWRLAHPAEADRIRRANHAVEQELKTGRMVRPSKCSRCPATQGIQAHHPSYERSQWLVVIWLCENCHAKEHHPIGSISGDGS